MVAWRATFFSCSAASVRHGIWEAVMVIGIGILLSFFYYAEMQALQDTPETLQWP